MPKKLVKDSAVILAINLTISVANVVLLVAVSKVVGSGASVTTQFVMMSGAGIATGAAIGVIASLPIIIAKREKRRALNGRNT